MSTPLVLDCDPGHDDAFAILLAAGDPEADLRAITTVGGNGDLDNVTRNALKVCTLAGVTDVPLARGAAGPLRGHLETAEDVHGRTALDGPVLPEPAFAEDPRDAQRLLLDTLEASDTPLTLVPTGPITNIGALLRDHPEIRPQIKEVVWMGGSTGRGNRTPYAEFNAYTDPEALQLVLDSGVPFTLVGLNVTHTAQATPDIVERIAQIGTPLAQVCADWIDFFAQTYRAVFDIAPPMHDPVALAIAIDPTIATLQPVFIAAETTGAFTRGATVVDLHGRLGRPHNARVATAIDVPRFWDRLLAAIAGLPR